MKVPDGGFSLCRHYADGQECIHHTCTTAVVTLWRSKACVPDERSSCRNGAWSRCLAASDMQVLSQRGMLVSGPVWLGMS